MNLNKILYFKRLHIKLPKIFIKQKLFAFELYLINFSHYQFFKIIYKN